MPRCPICNGRDGYRVGSGWPCLNCQREYQEALRDGDVPAGTSIRDWGKAIKAGEKVLSKGGGLADAKKAARQSLSASKASDALIARIVKDAYTRRPNNDPALRGLFK